MNNPYDINQTLYSDFLDYTRVDPDEIDKMEELSFTELLATMKDGTLYVFDTSGRFTVRRLNKDPINMTDEEMIIDFCARFDSLLRHSGCTLTTLAEETGISHQTLSRYARGLTEPRMSDLRKMARALKCTLNDFTSLIYLR